ncbi:hypothetical protein J2T13_000176 [Paenibacillus sp. DS2015]|uniref:hypothetical protein n=1 Tax=Paenibacillus sp. DS2015 TaxID=3373917 RepID=UPI003D196FAE
MREYNEVKRKARVGELVKATADDVLGLSGFKRDHTFAVTGIGHMSGGDYYGAEFTDNNGRGRSFWSMEDYVVLEPSDIIRINTDRDGGAERFRMVERKAAVGERVVIVHASMTNGTYTNGAVFTVDHVRDLLIYIDTEGLDIVSVIAHTEYRVLEPLTAAVPTQLSSLDPVDQYASNIAKLTTKVQALEKRVATLESANTAKVASGPVDTALPSFAKLDVAKTAQQIRDEIVARAKIDVARLVAEVNGCDWENSAIPAFEEHGPMQINFVVNREKRTVVALASWNILPGNICERGTAKAAAGEVFNVHIGRAIALHRALGLVVPAEYMSVPAPTEVRVGDVVSGTCTDGGYYSVNKAFTITEVLENGSYKYAENTGDWMCAGDVGQIIDDSREESEGVSA